MRVLEFLLTAVISVISTLLLFSIKEPKVKKCNEKKCICTCLKGEKGEKGDNGKDGMDCNLVSQDGLLYCKYANGVQKLGTYMDGSAISMDKDAAFQLVPQLNTYNVQIGVLMGLIIGLLLLNAFFWWLRNRNRSEPSKGEIKK